MGGGGCGVTFTIPLEDGSIITPGKVGALQEVEAVRHTGVVEHSSLHIEFDIFTAPVGLVHEMRLVMISDGE